MQEEIDVLRKQNFSFQQGYQEIMTQVNNVEDIFKICHFPSRLKLIRKIFQTGLSFDGTVFRTSYIHPAFMPILCYLETRKLLLFESIANIQSTSGKEKIDMLEQELATFIAQLIGESFIKY